TRRYVRHHPVPSVVEGHTAQWTCSARRLPICQRQQRALAQHGRTASGGGHWAAGGDGGAVPGGVCTQAAIGADRGRGRRARSGGSQTRAAMGALAILTARGGPKRIPRKNISPFRGKPMLAWPLEAARECRLFDEVMVSTEDAEIADLARRLGASVP